MGVHPSGRMRLAGIIILLLGLSTILLVDCSDESPDSPSEVVSQPDTPTGDLALCVAEEGEFETSGGTCSKGHSVDEYRFDWGEGVPSEWTDGTASHAWTEAGIYCVKAKAKCSNGVESEWTECLDVEVTSCHVVTAPLAPAGNNPLCDDEEADYAAVGGVCSEGHTVTEYVFDWGDGSDSGWTDSSESHSWAELGIYCVKVKAKCSEGLESEWSECLNVSVQECGPIADFSGEPGSGEAPLLVQFTDLSIPGSASIDTWSWDFGDGATSDEQSPSHEYTVGGSFTVSLTVATAIGSDAEVKENYVMVNRAPLQANEPLPAHETVEVNTLGLELSWKGSDPDGDNVTYQIHFGTSSPPPPIDQIVNLTSYSIDYPLFNNTTYYWQIDAVDDGTPMLETEGEIWSFTTEAMTTTTLYPSGADTYASFFFPDQNFCSSENLFVGRDTGGFRTYLSFDLASIPSEATILDGGWKLYLYQWEVVGAVAPEDLFSLYRNMENWSECSLSWNNRPNRDTSALHYLSCGDTEGVWVVFEDPGLANPTWLQMLQDMVAGVLPNYGFQLWANCDPDTYFSFYSTSYAESELHPRMEITYSWEE